MKLSILAGSASQSVNIFVRDSSSTTGAGLGAVAPAGGSLLAGTKLYYSFTGANASAGVAVSLAVLAAVNSAWSSAGIVTIDGTNMLGFVRVDIPNAALAGAKGRVVSFMLFGGTNMAPTPFEIELTGWDNQDGVRGALTALPNAAANAAGGLPVSIAGALDLDEMNVDIEAIQASTAGLTFTVANQVDANVLKIGGTTQTAADVGSLATEINADVDEIIVTLGVAGVGLTNLGDTRIANLDVASSTLATAANMAEANADLDELLVGVTVTTNSDKTGYALTTGERDSIANDILDLASGIETSLTLRQAMRAIASAVAGVLAGAATTTVTIQAAANAGTNRITATVDASGNRSAVTLNV